MNPIQFDKPSILDLFARDVGLGTSNGRLISLSLIGEREGGFISTSFVGDNGFTAIFVGESGPEGLTGDGGAAGFSSDPWVEAIFVGEVTANCFPGEDVAARAGVAIIIIGDEGTGALAGLEVGTVTGVAFTLCFTGLVGLSSTLPGLPGFSILAGLAGLSTTFNGPTVDSTTLVGLVGFTNGLTGLVADPFEGLTVMSNGLRGLGGFSATF